MIAIQIEHDILDVWHRNCSVLIILGWRIFIGGRPHAFLFNEVVIP